MPLKSSLKLPGQCLHTKSGSWKELTSTKTKSNSWEPMLGYSSHHSWRRTLWNTSRHPLYSATMSKVHSHLIQHQCGKTVSEYRATDMISLLLGFQQCIMILEFGKEQPNESISALFLSPSGRADLLDAVFLPLLVEGDAPQPVYCTCTKPLQACCQRPLDVGNWYSSSRWQTRESGMNSVSGSISGRERTKQVNVPV